MQDAVRPNTILTTFNLNIYEHFANVLTDRPGNFLHLNPIENVWCRLKESVFTKTKDTPKHTRAKEEK